MADQNNRANLVLVHWNCRSFPNKLNFRKYITDTQPDIVALQETFYKEHTQKPSFPSYTPIHTHKTTGRGGGLLLLVNNQLNFRVKQLTPYRIPNFEIQCIC